MTNNKDNVKRMGFGIVGGGMIAGFHAQAIEAMAQGELLAVYDIDPDNAAGFGAKYGCAAYHNLDEFLAHPGLELVTVATPSGLHLEAAEAIATAKKHILCEKPMEVSIDRIDRMIEVCEENGVMLIGILPRRFGEAVQQVKQAVDAGRLGSITLASATIKWYRDQAYYDSAGWRGTWQLDGGGALMNQSIHTVDLLLHFMGDVVSVQARAKTAAHKGLEVEDLAVVLLEFANGSLGVIEATTNAYSRKGHPAEVQLCGTEGSIFLSDTRLRVWEFKEETDEDESIRRELSIRADAGGAGAADPSAIDFRWHQRNFEEAVEAICAGRKSSVNAQEARRSVELIQAIYRSAQNGGATVELPLSEALR